MENLRPYRVDGPAFLSFSGGRTSAFMLHQTVAAFDGKLPSNLHVAFANTGKERPETLRFVHECASRWGVDVQWVEWRATPAQAEGRASLASWLKERDPEGRMVHPDGFERVGFNSASRDGEPFAALIAMKQRLPNWKQRWCTSFLKLEPLFALAKTVGCEPGAYSEIIGLRYDEQIRVFKGMENAEKHGRRTLYPLAKAKVTKADVMAFWLRQPFDLQLRSYEGNCDFCFLKGRGLRKRLIRDDASIPAWWDERERERDQWFDKRDRVRGLVAEVAASPEFGDDFEAQAEEYDTECGLHCGGEAA